MGVDIYIVDQNGTEYGDSCSETGKGINWLRNPLGLQSFILNNFFIDIRKYPFFENELDYKSYYPDDQRKKDMVNKVIELLIDLENDQKEYYIFFDKMDIAEHFISIHQLAKVKEKHNKYLLQLGVDNIDKYISGFHDTNLKSYKTWVRQFCIMILFLTNGDGRGWYVSS